METQREDVKNLLYGRILPNCTAVINRMCECEQEAFTLNKSRFGIHGRQRKKLSHIYSSVIAMQNSVVVSHIVSVRHVGGAKHLGGGEADAGTHPLGPGRG